MPWKVLVLLGASGTGKSTIARWIAQESGATWMQVDDLRLALQYSKVSLPDRTERLYWFDETPDFWLRPIFDVVDAFIDVATLMVPAVRVVIDGHVVTDVPMVIEGDGILPSLVADTVLRPLVAAGMVRFCCLAAKNVEELTENMLSRGRGDHLADHERVTCQAMANHAFSNWLVNESQVHGIPVIASRPFDTLAERIYRAVSRPCGPVDR